MDGKAALTYLKAAREQMLSLDDVQTDDAYQPRVMRAVPFRYQGRTKESCDEHIAVMRLTLEATTTTQLEPVLVALVDGMPFIVDGHHRLEAYRLAKRPAIPARVRELSRHDAIMASKVANTTPRALPMQEGQRFEAAWQYSADVTARGKKTLKAAGESLRSISDLFGISKTTVGRMVEKLETLDLTEYTKEARDPGTNFPCWRYVSFHGSPWQGLQEGMNMDLLNKHRAEKAMVTISKLREKIGPDAWRMVEAMLRMEGVDVGDSIRALAYDDSDSEF